MSRRKTITDERAKISLLLSQIAELVGQLDRAGAPADVVNTLDEALGDCREMIGDELDPNIIERSVWHIAARPPMTREQLAAEFVKRGLRRAS